MAPTQNASSGTPTRGRARRHSPATHAQRIRKGVSACVFKAQRLKHHGHIPVSSPSILAKHRKLGCYAMSRLAFARVARARSLNPKPHLAWEQTALNILQVAAEAHTVNALHLLVTMADHAGRTTVQQRDIYALKKLLDIFHPSSSLKKHA